MADTPQLKIQIGVASDGLKSNLERIQSEFDRLYGSILAAAAKTGTDAGKRLAALTAKYQSMANVAASRDFLGLKAHKDIQSQIDLTRKAYDTLAQSGQLSAKEIAQAWVAMRDKTRGLKNETNGWLEKLKEVKTTAIAAAGAFLGAGGMLGKAVQGAMEFERSFAGVKASVSGTPQQFQALSAEIVDMARNSARGTTELNALAAAAGRQGVAIGEIGKAVKVASDMSTAFQMASEEATWSMQRIRNSYKLTTDGVNDLGDAVTHLGATMGVKQSDIVDGLSRVSSAAKQFGLADKEAAALTATFQKLIPVPRTAASSMDSFLGKLRLADKQGAEFKNGLYQIGVNAKDMANMIEANPTAAIGALLSKLAELDNKKRAVVLTDMFGPGASDDINAVVSRLEEYQKAMAAVATQDEYAGAMAKMAKERRETTAHQLAILKNRVGEIGDTLGEVFLPAVNSTISALQHGASAVADFVRGWPGLVAGAVTAATGLSGLTGILAAHKAIYLLMPGPIDKARKAIAALNGTLAESGKGMTISDAFGQVKNKITAIPTAAKEAAARTSLAFSGMYGSVVSGAGNLKTKLADGFRGMADAVKNPSAAINTLGGNIKNLAQNIIVPTGNGGTNGVRYEDTKKNLQRNLQTVSKNRKKRKG